MNIELQEGLSILARRAAVARVFIVAVSGLTALYGVGVAGLMRGALGGDEMFVGDRHIVDLIAMVMALALLGSFIVVAMWIHRAHANLEAADLPALEYSPGWAIGWYVVPIANFFKPFQAMRELWHASHGAIGSYSDPAPGLLWVWWLCWLLSNISGYGETFSAADLVGVGMTIVSAGALLVIVNTVTERQHSMDIAQAFA